MGDPAFRQTDTSVTPPNTNPMIPYLPQTTNPTTTDVEQMINSRLQNAVDHLRMEFHGRTPRDQRNREIGVGLVGGVAGVLVFLGGRWVVSRFRANNPR